jgi:hypothetical protein
MQPHHKQRDRGAALQTPVRNNYFYGQLLGVENFELETAYGILQRRLLNRLVLGYGVVCGLGVDVLAGGRRITIDAGLGIDRLGREIVVPTKTQPITIPEQTIRSALDWADECNEDACIQVAICYHECLDEPQTALAGDCTTVDPCAPSRLRERYRVTFRDRCERRDYDERRSGRDLGGRRIDHERLAWWVTYGRDCGPPTRDPCIALANIAVVDPDDGEAGCDRESVDIGVRPVVWSNVLIRQLLMAALDRDLEDEGHYGQ